MCRYYDIWVNSYISHKSERSSFVMLPLGNLAFCRILHTLCRISSVSVISRRKPSTLANILSFGMDLGVIAKLFPLARTEIVVYVRVILLRLTTIFCWSSVTRCFLNVISFKQLNLQIWRCVGVCSFINDWRNFFPQTVVHICDPRRRCIPYSFGEVCRREMLRLRQLKTKLSGQNRMRRC